MTRSDLEKDLSAKRARAEAIARKEHPDAIEIIPAAWGSELYLEIKLPDGSWKRYAYMEEG